MATESESNAERESRIVATVIELAESGGFEAVRLRDVASQADVALGTLYKHFRSKEDLLVAALTQEARDLEERLRRRPAEGGTPLERVTAHFAISTRALCRRPKLARAVLHAVASEDPELSSKIRAFHRVVCDLVIRALRGDAEVRYDTASDVERDVCDVLHSVWYAALIGWRSGQYGQPEVIERVRTAAVLVLRGAEPNGA